ncbi:MAG: thiamine-phosphate kinase [Thermoanaerobaculia bacterium]
MGRGEKELIGKIGQYFPALREGLGIGDDAAVLPVRGNLVVTTDMLVEDVDFTRAIPLRFVAAKSLAANLSDVAAMGATPTSFTLTLGIPPDLVGRMDGFLEGLAASASRAGVELIGGDLSASEKLIVSITAFGRMEEGTEPLLRRAARPGERIFVSRPLGASTAGLTLLRQGWTIDEEGKVEPSEPARVRIGYAQRELAESVIRRHVQPDAEIALGVALAKLGSVGACIDISDGLSTDLHHLCDASSAGAIIEWEKLPKFPDLLEYGRFLGIDVHAAVLHGGEELALLFTSSARESELSARLRRPVYAIGRITKERDVVLRIGERTEMLQARGFDHFAGQEFAR